MARAPRVAAADAPASPQQIHASPPVSPNYGSARGHRLVTGSGNSV